MSSSLLAWLSGLLLSLSFLTLLLTEDDAALDYVHTERRQPLRWNEPICAGTGPKA